MVITQSNINPAIHLASSAFRNHHHLHFLHNRFLFPRAAVFRRLTLEAAKVRAFSTNETQSADDVDKLPSKPPICTADELHYVTVNNSDWRLALWRYNPSPEAPRRNHPLLLLSGVGTNAIGYDLSPGSSFARYMCGQGFDTWILEVRGAGLSTQTSDRKDVEKSAHAISDKMEAAAENVTSGALPADQQSTMVQITPEKSETAVVNEEPTGVATAWDESRLATEFTETFTRLSERLSGFLSEKRLLTTVDDFQKQLDLIVKYDWDFDHYLEEDIPVVMEYIRAQSKPKDGRLLAIGHSMGGILLYAMLSRYSSEGRDPGLAAIVTLASSLDYTSSKSSLKLLIPLADPAQALNVPVVPLGALVSASYPLSSRPPYVLSWMNDLISAQDMMHPELLKKLILNNFCTIPAKLLLQLATAFREGGLRDRSGEFFYKDHLHKSEVPVLALAGDRDLICPPEAVHGLFSCPPPNNIILHDIGILWYYYFIIFKVIGYGGVLRMPRAGLGMSFFPKDPRFIDRAPELSHTRKMLIYLVNISCQLVIVFYSLVPYHTLRHCTGIVVLLFYVICNLDCNEAYIRSLTQSQNMGLEFKLSTNLDI
ncbi:hypothetical protein DH2020_043920 [Rehmannia glutinosa]|uniref:AB hydrolase-1 domain-containing protein n=1 Tax=Rehmannia glutinosa TaxID=99300 RepID=A0ABR0UI91_REHGL